jgi:predicted nucleic acid-binding protein
MQAIDALSMLGVGERQALSLAQELKAAAIIIDEERGRNEAKRLGLPVIGILGVLRHAAERKLIELPAALERLRRTNFRVLSRLSNHSCCVMPSGIVNSVFL